MSKGIILIKNNLVHIAVNARRKPQEIDYFNNDESEFDSVRYENDVKEWRTGIDKSELICLTTDTLTNNHFQLLMFSEGKRVDFELTHSGKRILLTAKVELSTTMQTRVSLEKCVTTDVMMIITRFREDVSWIDEFTGNYMVINKGDGLHDFKEVQAANMGGNQYDICKYIYDNYDALPELICFVQGFPFDHCSKQRLKELINNKFFTPLESLEHIPESDTHKKWHDGGYMEINDSWYIAEHNKTLVANNHKITCKFTSYDDFMNSLFTDYLRPEWIRFTPGSQYIVTKEDCMRHSKEFWKHLVDFFPTSNVNGGTEAHLVERALYYIFVGAYKDGL